MSEKVFIGIDPGASGGLVAVHGNGLVDCDKMPSSEGGIWDWMIKHSRPAFSDLQTFALIEKVQGHMGGGQGGKGDTGHTRFKFGQSYGSLRMALVAAAIPFDEVTPQAWQKAVGVRRVKGEADSSWKGRLAVKARQLFPRLKVTLAVSDALLIAWHCRQQHRIEVMDHLQCPSLDALIPSTDPALRARVAMPLSSSFSQRGGRKDGAL